MNLKCRFIDHIGTPGTIEYHERNDIEEIISGTDLIVYIKGERVKTDPLIIPDGVDELTIVNPPQGPVGIAIGIGVAIIAGTLIAVDTINRNLQRKLDDLKQIGSLSSSPAKSIRGSKNSFRVDGRTPLVLGEVLVTPDWCSVPYTSYQDNQQYFHQLFCFGYSDVSLSELKIGDNPIGNYDVAYAEDLTHYPDLVSPNSINVELVEAGPLTYTTPDDTTSIDVLIAFYTGLRQYNNDGDAVNATVNFTIRHRVSGSPSWTESNISITDNQDYVRHTHSITGLSANTYEVQVERTTADNDSGTIIDTSYLDAINSFIGSSEPLSTSFQTNQKIISMKIRATEQLNGIIDSFNAVGSLSCRDWNGLGTGAAYWISGPTRNPASILLYVLTDDKACRRPIVDAKIQWDEFEALWTWCDTKGFNFDTTLTGDYTTRDIIRMIEVGARCKLTDYNGVYGVRIDQPVANVDFLLTPRNTAGAMTQTKPFNSATKNLECTFIDRDSGFVEVTRTVSIDPSNNIVWDSPQTGDTESVDFIGITDGTHMAKIAAFELAKYLRRNISYSVPQDWEQLTAFPGAVGYLANDMFLYSLGYGRVTGVTGTVGAYTGVFIDADVVFEAGKSYSCTIRMNAEADGVRIITLVNPEITTNYLEFTSPVAYTVEEKNLVTFGEQGSEGLKVICEQINQGDDTSGTLSLLPYAEEVYNADSGSIPAWVSGVTLPPAGGTGRTQTQIVTDTLSQKAASDSLTVKSYIWIKYSEFADGTDLTDTPVEGVTKYIGVATNKTTPVESADKTAYTWSEWVGDGGYGIYLTTPTYTFQATAAGYVDLVTFTTEVKALKGPDVVDVVVSKLTAPQGMTIVQTGTQIEITVEGSLLDDSGTLTIPVAIFSPVSGYVFGRDPDVYGRSPKVYGRTVNNPDATGFELNFTWSKAKAGPTGEAGTDGTNAARYLGRFLAAHPGTYEDNDFWLIYDTDDSPLQRGIWQSISGTPTRIANDTGSNSPLFSQPLGDILWAVNDGSYGTISDYGSIDYISSLVANSAFIANLGVQALNLAYPGYIKSDNYSAGTAGFKINYDGAAEFNDITARGDIEASSFSFENKQTTFHEFSGDYATGETTLETFSYTTTDLRCMFQGGFADDDTNPGAFISANGFISGIGESTVSDPFRFTLATNTSGVLYADVNYTTKSVSIVLSNDTAQPGFPFHTQYIRYLSVP